MRFRPTSNPSPHVGWLVGALIETERGVEYFPKILLIQKSGSRRGGMGYDESAVHKFQKPMEDGVDTRQKSAAYVRCELWPQQPISCQRICVLYYVFFDFVLRR